MSQIAAAVAKALVCDEDEPFPEDYQQRTRDVWADARAELRG